MEPFEGKRVIIWVTPRALNTDSLPQAGDLSAVSEALSRLGCRVEMLTSEQEVGERLARPSSGGRRPDLILAHVCHKCRGPLEMLTRFEARMYRLMSPPRTEPLPPVVLLATAHDMPVYLEGMRRGAFDCVGLPLQEKEFIRILSRALQERVLQPTT